MFIYISRTILRSYVMTSWRRLLLFVGSLAVKIGSAHAMLPCPITRSLACSGTCACTPHTATHDRTIHLWDGPGMYQNNMNCQYLVTSNYIVTLRFIRFIVERDRDFVTINRCTTASCAEKVQLVRATGSAEWEPVYASTATHPFLQLVFTSDGDKVTHGWEVNWNLGLPAPMCAVVTPVCISGQYEQAYTCSDCAANSNSPAGSTGITACVCNAGYTGPNGGPCYNPDEMPCPVTRSLACSGACTCTPHTSTHDGVIVLQDGPGLYGNKMICQYLVTSNYTVTLQFVSFLTEQNMDFVTINRCTTATCAQKIQLLYESGITSLSTVYASDATHPFLQLVFTTDSSVTLDGWVVNWNLGLPAPVCVRPTPVCISGEYERVNSCWNCTANSTSPAGSTGIASCVCNAGYTGPNAGTCSPCPVDTYKEGLGPANCTTCPENSVSAAASIINTACLCKPGHAGENGGTCSPCPLGKYRGN